jgi:glucose-6-phosphate isomerase
MTLYRHIADYCGQDAIGVHGLSQSEIDAPLLHLSPALGKLQKRGKGQGTALCELACRTDDLEGIEQVADFVRRRFSHVVIVGSGGSGLSGKALLAFAPSLSPRFHVLDNIDPAMMEDILAQVDIASTCFLVISKTGTTVESLAQFYVLVEMVKNACGRSAVRTQFIVITGEQKEGEAANPMRELAAEYEMKVLDFEEPIGGRFAILTNVGLLPAAIAGIDIRGLRAGAKSVVDELDAANATRDCKPALGAALQFGFYQRSRNISVMLPYCERLSGFSAWYRQGWAESLGKDGKGSTPIRAVGSRDQHSQLQLYLSGPKDKLFHLITLKRDGQGPTIQAPQRADLAYIQGRTLGDIMAAQQRATLETLTRNRCPTRVFELEKLGAPEMGALLMHFMLEIIFMAHLLEVNPFDQPAVEESKHLARDYLLGNI